MTLRLRLVLGLLVLLTVGLAIFGFRTYALLLALASTTGSTTSSLSSIPLVTGQLYREAGLAGGPYRRRRGRTPAAAGPPRPRVVPPARTASCARADGTVLAAAHHRRLDEHAPTPALAADLTPPATGSDLFTTGLDLGLGYVARRGDGVGARATRTW